MPITLSKSTSATDGSSPFAVMVALAQNFAAIKAAAVSDLTDSSSGTASSAKLLVAVPANLANVAASGSSLASKTTAEAQLNLVKDAILELATKANAVAAATGVSAVTYNGGGTAVDGTIAAIGATTGATTGVLAANTNAMILALNNAMFTTAKLINKLATATGATPLTIALVGSFSATVAAITIDGGTAADPGVTKVDLDAKLTLYKNNIATMAAVLNAITGSYTNAVIVVD